MKQVSICVDLVELALIVAAVGVLNDGLKMENKIEAGLDGKTVLERISERLSIVLKENKE